MRASWRSTCRTSYTTSRKRRSDRCDNLARSLMETDNETSISKWASTQHSQKKQQSYTEKNRQRHNKWGKENIVRNDVVVGLPFPTPPRLESSVSLWCCSKEVSSSYCTIPAVPSCRMDTSSPSQQSLLDQLHLAPFLRFTQFAHSLGQKVRRISKKR